MWFRFHLVNTIQTFKNGCSHKETLYKCFLGTLLFLQVLDCVTLAVVSDSESKQFADGDEGNVCPGVVDEIFC